MTKPRIIILLSTAMFLVGCNSHNSDRSAAEAESFADTTVVDSDSLYSSARDSIDWTPAEFKSKHHDEWVVVNQCISIQQRGGKIDFNKIDKLVREYISTKKIDLPKDKYLQIKKIEEICTSKFDISGYDDSNMGMNIADGTAGLFRNYVNWLYEGEARKVKGTGINITEEEKRLETMMNAFIKCCDSIGHDFEGSGHWAGYSEVSRISSNFKKSMYISLLRPQTHSKMPILLTPNQFRAECTARAKAYKRDCDDDASPQAVKVMLDNYYRCVKEWLEYRNKIEKGISNSTLRADYSYNTRLLARKHYIHLKNMFGDIGFCPATMYDECYLHEDCTDQEMLDYSYDKALKKYLEE